MMLAAALVTPDPTAIVSWPAAAVAITVVLAGVVVQVVNLYMTHQVRRDAAEAAGQTRHNGGSSQRDEITAIGNLLAEHIDADTAWKASIERRLPPA